MVPPLCLGKFLVLRDRTKLLGPILVFVLHFRWEVIGILFLQIEYLLHLRNVYWLVEDCLLYWKPR